MRITLTVIVTCAFNIGSVLLVPLENNLSWAQKMGSQAMIKDVDFKAIKSLKDDGSVLLIDVREPSELKESGVIPTSINIPLEQVEQALKNMDDGEFHSKYGKKKPSLKTPIIFSCKSGKRAETAAKTAINLGYADVSKYPGSWMDWEEKIKQH